MSFVDELLGEVTAALRPLIDAATDPWLLDHLLAQVAVNSAQLQASGFVAQLTSIGQAASDLQALIEVPPETLAAVGATLDATRQLVEAVKALANGTPAGTEHLAADLVQLVVLRYVAHRWPLGYQIGIAAAFIDSGLTRPGGLVQIPMPTDVVAWSAFEQFFADPKAVLRGYFSAQPLATLADANTTMDTAVERFGGLATALGIPWRYGYADADAAALGAFAPRLDHAVLLLAPPSWIADDDPLGVVITLSPADQDDLGVVITPFGSFTVERDLTAWHLSLTGSADIQALALGGGTGFLVLASSGAVNASLGITLTQAPLPDGTPYLVGTARGTRLELSGTTAHAKFELASAGHNVDLGIEVPHCVFILTADGADGFIASVLGNRELRTTIDFGLAYTTTEGLHLKRGSGLTAQILVDLSVGPLSLQAISLSAAPTAQAVELEIGSTVGVSLGPVTVTVHGLGIRARATLPSVTPPATFDLDFGLLPPSGAGLAITAEPITGGGRVDRDPSTGRYSGILYLHAHNIDITALGLIDTTLPGRDPGYALLIALHATFPAIQIGMGFALTGVGGLIALNRRINVDVLRNRLAAGTAGRVLAPQDPIANAPALLADLDAVFPTTLGVHVVGPTVQLIWADLVHFDVGVFIELPGPTRIVLLGSAHAEIQRDGRSYLTIRVDILGDIDISAKKVSFDAVLVDSHLMGMLDLTGGAAFRLSGGAQPYAVLTLGGFHPAYNPEPLAFPASLTRIAMVHGSPRDELYLRFEGYFAVTSNTLQFGAGVEALIHKSGFTIHGMLAFDALIQFVPFHFQFDIRAAVDVSYRSRRLAGLTLTGALSGPGPVVLRAKVCIELLFFDICFSHTFKLGPSTPPPLPAAPDLLTTLLAELTDPARLRGDGADPHVQLRAPDPAAAAVTMVIPTGVLIWQQNKAPLQLLLDRVGGTPLPGPVEVRATTTVGSAPTTDWFAPGQFLNLTDDQALTRPGYEMMPNGLRLGDGNPVDGPGAQQTLQMTEIRLPSRIKRPTNIGAFPDWMVGQPARTLTPIIKVTVENWTVTTPAGEVGGLTGAQASRLADLTPAAHAVPSIDQLPAMAF